MSSYCTYNGLLWVVTACTISNISLHVLMNEENGSEDFIEFGRSFNYQVLVNDQRERLVSNRS